MRRLLALGLGMSAMMAAAPAYAQTEGSASGGPNETMLLLAAVGAATAVFLLVIILLGKTRSTSGVQQRLGTLSDKGDVNYISRGWVADLLGLAVDELPLKERYSGHHRWKDAETYLAFAKKMMTQVRRDVADLQDRLVKAGFLTKKQRAAISIEPRVKVHDGRDDKSEPLPDITGAPVAAPR